MSKSTEYCRGCRDDFYNGQNNLGIKECWSLKNAKVVTRWRQGWWDDPCAPGTFVEVKTHSCHHETGRYAFNEKLPDYAVDPIRLEPA